MPPPQHRSTCLFARAISPLKVVQVPRRESLTLLFRSKRQEMAKTTLHDSAALHRGVIPLCRGGGTAARPRAPPRCRSFAACPAAVSPIRFRSPPFKREYEYLSKHLAINQLLLFTARRHTVALITLIDTGVLLLHDLK
jgi:hypothetical protein